MARKAPQKAEIIGTDKRSNIPPLGMVKVFEAVGRLGSMRRAADELNISHTVVSRHVRNLEAWLGARLLIAGARGIKLTADGERFCRVIGRALDQIADATVELRPGLNRVTLKLWCAPGLATRWLAPRLVDLQKELPTIDLVLHATEAHPDFVRHDADMVVRYGSEPRGDLRWALLCKPRIIPVASRAWLDAQPTIATLADLEKRPLIHEGSHDQWREWFDAAGHNVKSRLQGPRLGAANLAVEAAIMGQGVALATELLAADDLYTGRLVEILGTEVYLENYYMISSRERWNSPAVSKFRAWMISKIKKTQKD